MDRACTRKLYAETTNPFEQYYSMRKCNFDKKDELCAAGFTYTGKIDIVKCLTCGLQTSVKLVGNIAAQYHLFHSPNCERAKSLKQFLNSSQHKDIEHVERLEIVYDRQPEDGIHMYPGYKREEERHTSFSGWTYGNIQQPSHLARAGFFSNGDQDQVICYSCGLWLAEWESNEHPLIVHACHSPKCAFVNKALSTSGINAIQRYWRQVKDTILLVCHYCGVRIIPWKCNVNPWEMHIRWCQNCKFVETRKGQKFISFVYNKYKDAQEKIRHQYDNPMVSFEDEEVMCTQEEILQGVCVKCKKKKVTTVFADCGHRITCLDCASKYLKCPYCGTKKTKTPVEAFH